VFTHTVARLGGEAGREHLDKELVEAASALLGGGAR
jgi:hypothetical protein